MLSYDVTGRFKSRVEILPIMTMRTDVKLKKVEIVVTTALAGGVLLSYLSGRHAFIITVAVIIPFYLAYVRRESNLLAKSRFYDRDLITMSAVAVALVLLFKLIWDPRVGLIVMVIMIPIIAILSDRKRNGRGSQ